MTHPDPEVPSAVVPQQRGAVPKATVTPLRRPVDDIEALAIAVGVMPAPRNNIDDTQVRIAAVWARRGRKMAQRAHKASNPDGLLFDYLSTLIHSGHPRSVLLAWLSGVEEIRPRDNSATTQEGN